MLLFKNVSFFYFSLTALPLLPLKKHFCLYVTATTTTHDQYHNSRMIHQDRCKCYDQLYCHFHDSYTCWCSDAVYTETNNKKPINKVQLEKKKSFRHVISLTLICQECLVSLNSVLSLIKQMQTY